MKRSILETYALAVCVAGMAVLILGLGFSAWSGLRMARPDLSMDSGEFARHESDGAFARSLSAPGEGAGPAPALSGEALTLARKASYARALNSEWRAGRHDLLLGLLFSLMAALVLGGHFLLLRCAGATRRAQAPGTPRHRAPPSPA